MKLIDLDTIDFLEAENNKEFNRGVDNCINRLLKAPIGIAIVILVVILLALSNDKLAYIFGALFYLALAISGLTFLVHHIFFSWR